MIRAKILASGCALAATLVVSAVYAGHGSARGRVTPPYITRAVGDGARPRSEEHTSELQSQSNLVCRLLLEKKKKKSTKRRPRPHRTSTAVRRGHYRS